MLAGPLEALARGQRTGRTAAKGAGGQRRRQGAIGSVAEPELCGREIKEVAHTHTHARE